MKFHILAMVGVIILMIVLVMTSNKKMEAFVDASTSADEPCPLSAERTEDGKILVKPGDRLFETMTDYTQYLSGLYAKGKNCIPPQVKSNKEPIAGILGGLGAGKEGPEAANQQSVQRQVLDTDMKGETLSANKPIDKLDDYEYTRVFQLEDTSRQKVDREQKNDLLRKRAVDWSILPFDSSQRAKEEEAFVSGRMEDVHRDPKTGVLFEAAEAKGVEPPDQEAAHLREQQVLASYRPTEISKHTIDSETEAVAKLVSDQYSGDPHWEPVVKKVGDNKWEVVELRPKPRKERYEEEKTVDAAMTENPDLQLPTPSIDINDRMSTDPYFDKSSGKEGKIWNYNDFKKWTPGLERMFAPTADNKAWY